MTYNLVMIGFGAVGQGFAALLQNKAAELADRYGFQAKIIGVYTRRASLFCPDGLAIPALLAAAQQNDLTAYADHANLRRDLNAHYQITHPATSAVIEASLTNYVDAEPALGHIRTAFSHSKHVVTVNKGPIALAYGELAANARRSKCFFGYEGVVMGGTPCIRLAEAGLAGARIEAVRGIVNGTTNFILGKMEAGMAYAEALAEAQRLGYAEADPTADVEGFDAAGKIVILATLLFGAKLTVADVDRTGITQISMSDVQNALAAGQRWKLIASLQREKTENGERVLAKVSPERLPLSDPLAGIGGGGNAITYLTDTIGGVTLTGAGAGGKATGFAVLADLLAMHARYGN
jgi:homoserine dehydrogenase